MSNYSQDILLHAEGLSLGENTRVLCPACGGGSDEEKSLSVTHCEDGTVRWQCFRENCPMTTGSVSHNYRATQERILKVTQRKTFEGQTMALRDSDLEWISDHWGIDKPLHWYYTPEMGQRIAMSIRSPRYVHRGWVLRDIKGYARTKALTYLDQQEIGLSWYKTDQNAPTVVVEDIPSALRASLAGVNAVALLGTSMGLDKAIEIARFAPQPIMLALDDDATDKSFKIIKKVGLLLGRAKILPLKQDIKDMEEADVEHLFKGIQ